MGSPIIDAIAVQPRRRGLGLRCGGLLAALLASGAPAAAAQQDDPGCPRVAPGQPLEIGMGLCFRSAIEDSDPRNPEDVPYEDWRLRLAAGETVQIDMDALIPPPAAAPAGTTGQEAADRIPEFAFDTYLELRRPGVQEPLAANDDRGGSLNSTVTFTAAEAGDYVVRARPLFSGRGEYMLRVGRPAPPPVAVALVPGTNAVAAPDAQGGTIQERLFSFDGNAGDRIRLRLGRRGFGDALQLQAPNDGGTIAMAGELSDELEITALLPEAGTYRVVVQLHRSGQAEPSALEFARSPAVEQGAPARIRMGESVDGEIGLNSPAGSAPYGGPQLQQLYELRLRRGEVVTVTLESTAFDPVIDAGTMSSLGFATAMSDDDGGLGLNSRLVLRPQRAGPVVLRVRPLGNRMGAYRLRVVAGETPPPAE
jgi:hypothetical protein